MANSKGYRTISATVPHGMLDRIDAAVSSDRSPFESRQDFIRAAIQRIFTTMDQARDEIARAEAVDREAVAPLPPAALNSITLPARLMDRVRQLARTQPDIESAEAYIAKAVEQRLTRGG